MSGYIALEIDQHVDFSRIITIRTSSGAPQDLTGANVDMQIRKSYFTSSSNNIPAVVSNGINGEITLSMDGANTANLYPGRYVYDVVVTHSTGGKQRILEGIVVVNPGVTR